MTEAEVEAGTSTDVVKDAPVEAEAPALGFQEDTTADPLKATEAPVEATNTTVEGAAGEGAESAAKPIYLAGRAFTSRNELAEHVKKIQDSKANEDVTKGDLTVEENLFIFHLLLHHPKA